MKASLLFGFVSLALLPLCAEELTLTPNTPYKGPVTSENDTKTLTTDATLGTAQTLVLSATLTFTLPSEKPDIAEVATEKLAIACDTDGQILVANGDAWLETDFFVEEGKEVPVPVKAVGKVVEGVLKFDVTLGSVETKSVTVTSPDADTTLTTLSFTGEGSASDITLALVDTAILPAPDGGTQDAEQVAKYVDWLNNETKGGALADATDAELSDAFAMNVGGTPKLEITDITPATDSTPGSITVKGYYTQGETPHETSLKDINGILYITWSETLTGEAKMTTEKIAIDETTGIATIELPDNAKFVKATVSLVAPDTTETTTL